MNVEPIMGDGRALSPDEQAAIDMVENAGVFARFTITENRPLDQHETNCMIADEVHVAIYQRDGARAATASLGIIGPWINKVPKHWGHQRGGIHSDPLVRLFAYRCWNDRDRFWKVTEFMCVMCKFDRVSMRIDRMAGHIRFDVGVGDVNIWRSATLRSLEAFGEDSKRGVGDFVYRILDEMATEIRGPKYTRHLGGNTHEWSNYVNEAMSLVR